MLFNWTWAMGMLRGLDEHELVATLEYQGNGTIQVDGQPCTLTKHRISNNYQTPVQRIQYTCTRANGETYSNIEVVSGEYAWNEGISGAEIVVGKGKATAMPRADATYRAERVVVTLAERVVVTQGSTTTEFTYTDYEDWNSPLNKIEAYFTRAR